MEERELKEIMKTTFVNILLTKKCDARCWYCDVGVEDSPMVSLVDMDCLVKFVNEQEKPNAVFHLFGGEPTLNPELNAFVDLIYRHCTKNVTVILTTNLHKDRLYWNNLDSRVKVTASFHSEMDIDAWFEKVDILKKRNMLYRVVLMVNNKNVDYIKTVNDKYRKKYNIIVVPISQHIENPIFKEMFDNLEKDEEEIFFDKKATCMCSSGFVVMPDGNVHYCWNRLDEVVFNVFAEPETIIPPWHICNRYGDECDKEIVRCSLSYYAQFIKGMRYDSKPNKMILFRCNV